MLSKYTIFSTVLSKIVALKKKLTIFLDFLSIFQTLLQVWKIAGQISRLFLKEFKAPYETCHPQYQETLNVLQKLCSYRKDMRDSQLGFCPDDVPLKRKCLCYNSCRRSVPFRFGKSLLKSIIAYRIVLVRVCNI